jgi:hypothetical protein
MLNEYQSQNLIKYPNKEPNYLVTNEYNKDSLN